MKKLIYIGNKSGIKKNANVSAIDLLEPLFTTIGYQVFSASNKPNKFVRMVDMLWVCFKYRKNTDFVLIDTYSTLNFYYAFIVSQFCRMLRLKYIPVLHGGNLPDRLKSNPKMSNALFNHAYTNVAPSEYVKSNFENFGYSNLVCIPNAFKIKNYPFKPRQFDKVKLLWVRAFSKIYNPLLAIDILKKMKDENIEASLCMVGPDSDGSMEKVKKHAAKLGVEIMFTGKLEKEEWVNLSEDYNIFINTTNFDNMPVSVIEAMALGLPVVSTNVGGMPFLIEHNQDGILVAPNNATAFVDEIKQICRQPEFANLLTLKARKKVEQFNWETVKHKWIDLLQ